MFTKEDCSKNLQIENWSLSEPCPVNAGHYMAFKHFFSFETDLAANFGCNRFRTTPDIVAKLLRAAIWSSCSVRFKSEQTPFLRTGHRQTGCFARDSIRSKLFCSYVIFLLRDEWLIERFSEAMGAALVGNNFSPIPSKFSFHMKQKLESDSSLPKITKH